MSENFESVNYIYKHPSPIEGLRDVMCQAVF